MKLSCRSWSGVHVVPEAAIKKPAAPKGASDARETPHRIVKAEAAKRKQRKSRPGK